MFNSESIGITKLNDSDYEQFICSIMQNCIKRKVNTWMPFLYNRLLPKDGSKCISTLKFVNVWNLFWAIPANFYIIVHRIKVSYELWH
jgi:hypothetical protein